MGELRAKMTNINEPATAAATAAALPSAAGSAARTSLVPTYVQALNVIHDYKSSSGDCNQTGLKSLIKTTKCISNMFRGKSFFIGLCVAEGSLDQWQNLSQKYASETEMHFQMYYAYFASSSHAIRYRKMLGLTRPHKISCPLAARL